MSKTIPIGSKGVAEERVQFDHTLSAHHHELPPVYSTPDMIRLMETAGFHAMHPFCEKGEISVGTAIDIKHLLPVGLNAVVKAEAVVEAFDGKFYTLRVKATEGQSEIGSGTIQRTIIHIEPFLKKHGIPKP